MFLVVTPIQTALTCVAPNLHQSSKYIGRPSGCDLAFAAIVLTGCNR